MSGPVCRRGLKRTVNIIRTLQAFIERSEQGFNYGCFGCQNTRKYLLKHYHEESRKKTHVLQFSDFVSETEQHLQLICVSWAVNTHLLPELCHSPHCMGELTVLTRLLAGLKGPLCIKGIGSRKGREEEKRGENGKKRERKPGEKTS